MSAPQQCAEALTVWTASVFVWSEFENGYDVLREILWDGDVARAPLHCAHGWTSSAIQQAWRCEVDDEDWWSIHMRSTASPSMPSWGEVESVLGTLLAQRERRRDIRGRRRVLVRMTMECVLWLMCGLARFMRVHRTRSTPCNLHAQTWRVMCMMRRALSWSWTTSLCRRVVWSRLRCLCFTSGRLKLSIRSMT